MNFRQSWGWIGMTAAIGCSLALSLAIVAIADDKDSSGGREGTTQLGDEMPAIELAGKGRQASKKFRLDEGLCILEVTNKGNTNFILRLLDSTGKEVDTLVNQIGPFAGQIGFEVERAGQCLLDVETNGNWTAKLTQPRPQSAQTVPTSMSGKGYKATQFFQLDRGLAIFRMNTNGQGRFIARLMDSNGRIVDQLVNTLGQFEGSKPLSVESPGVYFLNVSADGNWTVEIE